jgi:hypothetical protein
VLSVNGVVRSGGQLEREATDEADNVDRSMRATDLLRVRMGRYS